MGGMDSLPSNANLQSFVDAEPPSILSKSTGSGVVRICYYAHKNFGGSYECWMNIG